MLTILGLSFNTRNLGLAVVKLDRLVDYSSKLHKQKWTSVKMEVILTNLASCIDAYTIQKIALSIPHIRHQTSEFRDMMRAIIALAQMRNIEVITYTPQDLFLFIPDAKKKTAKVFMICRSTAHFVGECAGLFSLRCVFSGHFSVLYFTHGCGPSRF